ncbi:MAG: tetratricopeptide repeat protein [Actinomycetota bacterium]|nr:tetratricopeptide repeat protein [Actinomycetota bacterium]
MTGVLIGAGQAVVTNFATVEVPEFFKDQVRVWLVLSVLVLLVVIVQLLSMWPRGVETVTPRLTVAAPASLRPPATSVAVLRGRETELTRAMTLVKSPAGRFLVVCGAGGMGKTTLAIMVADQARQHGQSVFWVRWRDVESLTAQMVEVACALGLSPTAVAAVQESGASLADLVWRHLSTLDRWVLVLDNIDKPTSISPDDPVAAYRGWVRPGGAGLLLVTSRDRSRDTWGHDADLIELAPLSPLEGAHILRDLAPHAGSAENAQELASRLGGLPLALHAAGTALASPTARLRTFTAYQQALVNKSTQVLSEHPDITDREVARTLVGHTWELSLDQLAEEGHPLARPLLRALSLLAEAPIPLTLITPALIPDTTDDTAGRALVDAALAQLHRYSLLDAPEPSRTTSLPTVALHPLVRQTNALLLAHDDPNRWQRVTHTAVLTLADACATQGPPAVPLIRLLTPHLISLLTPDTLNDLDTFTTTRNALDSAADQLHNSGDTTTEITLRLQVLHAETTRLGAEHPDTLTSQGNLALALNGLGRYQEAADLHRATLDTRRLILGAEHPDTLDSQNNLLAVQMRLSKQRGVWGAFLARLRRNRSNK